MATTVAKRAVNTLKSIWFLMILTIGCVIYVLNTESGWIRQHNTDRLPVPTNKQEAILNIANNTNVTLQAVNDGYKKILFWTKFYDSPEYNFGFGRKPFVDWCTTAAGFTQQRCETTSNRSEIDSSDAVIIHIRDINLDDQSPKLDLPENLKRRPEQVWIFYLTESPVYTFIPRNKRGKLNGIFNLTMTYRRDSDVQELYFYVRRKMNKDPTSINVTNILKDERRLVAWLVTHCGALSKRENYAEQLKKYIPIDVYGGCGNKCPGNSSEECLDFVFGHYKFYLAFENSLCNDYVTEKFSNALERGVVPIVYGGADYNAIAPPNSFINIEDFKSPQQLAEYIQLLNSNDALYLNYFRWRQDYEVVTGRYAFCSLCQKLHNTDTTLSSNRKVYDDMVSWWYTKGECY